jgi:hypothetical protein
MRTAHLKGMVLPVEAKCTLPEPLSFNSIWQERNTTLEFTVSIQDGYIDVECTVPFDYRDVDAAELQRRAFDLCRAVVNLQACREGVGLTVILDKFINPHGIARMLLRRDGALSHLCTAIHNDDEFHQVFEIVVADEVLIRHLSDLIVAVTLPQEAVVNCARVVEGIKALITPTADGRTGWEGMHDALNVEKDYLTLITETSRKPRHGRHERIGGVLVTEVVRRSWSIMNRFLEYQKRGNVNLPLSEFPTLKA